MKGNQKTDYTDSEKLKVGKSICDLYKTGKTIDFSCRCENVSLAEFYQWTKQIPELKEYFRWSKLMCDGIFDADVKILARKKLLQRLEGETVKRHKITIDGKVIKGDFSNAKEFKDLIEQLSKMSLDGCKITIVEETIPVPPSDSLLLEILRNVDEWD